MHAGKPAGLSACVCWHRAPTHRLCVTPPDCLTMATCTPCRRGTTSYCLLLTTYYILLSTCLLLTCLLLAQCRRSTTSCAFLRARSVARASRSSRALGRHRDRLPIGRLEQGPPGTGVTSLQRSATSVRPAEMAHGALARSAAEMCVALRLLIQNKDTVYKAVSSILFLKQHISLS